MLQKQWRDSMKKIIVIEILFLITILKGFSQIFTPGFNENELKIRVKQLSEFMSRFNYENDFNGQKVDTFNIETRKKYILSLFDNKMFEESPCDSLLELVKKFITSVCQKEQFLKFTDHNWYSVAKCKANYKGEDKDLAIILKPEKVKEFEYKWVIFSVKAEFLTLNPQKENPGLMISPVDNELNFMDLHDVLKRNSTSVINYAKKDYKVDALTVLFSFIKSEQLKISPIEKVKYHFLQIPNWAFTVEHFEREEGNVGWLISSIRKMNDSQKANYKKKVLNIY